MLVSLAQSYRSSGSNGARPSSAPGSAAAAAAAAQLAPAGRAAPPTPARSQTRPQGHAKRSGLPQRACGGDGRCSPAMRRRPKGPGKLRRSIVTCTMEAAISGYHPKGSHRLSHNVMRVLSLSHLTRAPAVPLQWRSARASCHALVRHRAACWCNAFRHRRLRLLIHTSRDLHVRHCKQIGHHPRGPPGLSALSSLKCRRIRHSLERAVPFPC
jgi:hypothetical protein